jgi:putative DNA methylase
MRRLIEEAFPLKKVSEDSKHEKSAGRMGHISTLHIWPARRPLAASRAAVIAALLPDPGDAPPEVRSEYERLAGSSDPVRQREDLCSRIEKVTRWGGIDERELDILRGLIRKAYGGKAPKVLDIFAGGGAIPLEAMRLGCHAIAVEYNPVAWFILKCTLEFPSKLAGKTWPLPKKDDEGQSRELFARDAEAGDLAAHVRYWGEWVRKHVEEELRPYFPVVDGKPPVAYFWARTVPCQDPKCGATVPLLKTLWLCTRKGHERALRLKPNSETRQVEFEVFAPTAESELGRGTVEGTHAQCPFHDPPLPIPLDYVKECGRRDRLGVQLTAVRTEGPSSLDYRPPVREDLTAVDLAEHAVSAVMEELPGGLLHEPLCESAPSGGPGVSRLPKFGLIHFGQVYAPRQQLALGVIANWIRRCRDVVAADTRDALLADAIEGYLYCVVARVADRNSSLCTWVPGGEFVRNALGDADHLSFTWDFCEVPPMSEKSGGYPQALEYIASVVQHLLLASKGSGDALWKSATDLTGIENVNAIITDPPYYGAIPYADLSDYFYVWLRRTVDGRLGEMLSGDLAPRHAELVQHAAYANGDQAAAKRRYEEGMANAFREAATALDADGTMVVVFANKDPQAWDALLTFR